MYAPHITDLYRENVVVIRIIITVLRIATILISKSTLKQLFVIDTKLKFASSDHSRLIGSTGTSWSSAQFYNPYVTEFWKITHMGVPETIRIFGTVNSRSKF